MILYNYRCEDCGAQHKEMRMVEDRREPSECPNCGGSCELVIGAPRFATDINSDKWVKNRQQVMKREQKCLKEHGTYK